LAQKYRLAAWRGFRETRRMDTNSQPPTAPSSPTQWNADQIFSILADPARRHILLSLSRCKPSPASVIRGWGHLRLDAPLKQLAVLCSAGLLVTSPDPPDGRRTLYALAPAVPVVKTAEGAVTIDFGFCLLRA
jgi:hypothetical protein